MEIMSFKPTKGQLQLAPTMGLVVTGNGASCNTFKIISQNVCFRKYSIDGDGNSKQKDSNFDI